MMDSDFLTNSEIKITVIKCKRKTVSMHVKQDSEVVVRAPLRMSNKEIEDFIQKNKSWLEKQLLKVRQQAIKDETIPKLSDTELNHLVRVAQRKIPERVAYYAPLVGTDYKRITIRKQHTRWGSCSKTGNLNFNVLLLLAPPEVLDSVVVHELCHRLEMNHSPKFYEHVYRVFPDYDRCDRWLKENGKTLLHRLPPQ